MRVLSFITVITLFISASAWGKATGLIADTTIQTTNKVQLTDSLLRTIDLLHDKANEIETLSEQGFNLEEIKSALPQIVSDIQTLKTNLKSNVQVMDTKSLQTFEALLEDSHERLNEWRKTLLGYNQQLVNMQTEIQLLHQNKLLQAYKSDSLFVKLYNTELNAIETSWTKAKTFNSRNLKEISSLQATVTTNYYESGDLKKELAVQIHNYSKRVFGNEYPYIWQSSRRNVDAQALKFLNASLLTQRQMVGNYLKDNVGYQAFLTLGILAAFIYWIRKNHRKLIEEKKNDEWLQFTKGGNLSAFPFLPALIVVLNLAPFFDLNPPQAYIALLQFLLFIITSIFIFRHWPKNDRTYWVGIAVAFVIFIGINSVFNPGTLVRLGLIVVNTFLAYHSLYFIRNKCTELQLTKFTKTVCYIFLVMNVLSVMLNITGRVTLARALSNAAIVGFVQIVALSIFINIAKTAFLLQAHTASVVKNGDSVINYEKMNSSLSRFLSVIVIILWVMVFAFNMGIYKPVFEGLGIFLFKARMVGTTTFTIGNILLFFFVIYLSSIAQKYVGYLFGENSGHAAPGERKGSKAVMAKLIVIVVGFLIAVLVSGLPVDKLTVVIGALGVGIGLGLQTIINNFVSGIILIFERPLQIGDYVEVSGYKGWVNDIGIRATRLSSSEGAEILVPNGTILSGNLVNWTLHNSQIRLELNLKISPQTKVQEARELINKIIIEDPGVVSSRTPEIFNQSVNDGSAELKIWFWIHDVSKQQTVRSKIIENIYSEFESHEIKLL